jgi:hypothetical protein
VLRNIGRAQVYVLVFRVDLYIEKLYFRFFHFIFPLSEFSVFKASGALYYYQDRQPRGGGQKQE